MGGGEEKSPEIRSQDWETLPFTLYNQILTLNLSYVCDEHTD